jgi:ribonuclease-3
MHPDAPGAADGTGTDAVQSAIGYRFVDGSLLETSLTHTSFASEHRGPESYERLEFLGDAVLELATTEIIYTEMGLASEGLMTKIRAAVVDESTLAVVARRWSVPQALRVGVGEERSGGRDRSSILSDVVEAILAAVYLDGGFAAAAEVIDRAWRPVIMAAIASPDATDARSQLQELLAKQGGEVVFTYVRTGPDHAVVFAATATVKGDVIGTGSGGSKKAAAIDAAGNALANRT